MQLPNRQKGVLIGKLLCLFLVASSSTPSFCQAEIVERIKKLISSGHANEAIPLLTKILKASPSNEEALYWRGTALEDLDSPEKALPDFNRLIDLDKKVSRYYRGRSHVLVELGRNEQALQDLNESMKLAGSSKDKFWSLIERGKVWRILGNMQKAIDDFTAALAIKPMSSVYKERGNAEGDLNRWHEAVKDYSAAIAASSPTEVHVHSYYSLRAAAYRKLGDIKHAKEDEAKATSTIDDQFGAFFDPMK